MATVEDRDFLAGLVDSPLDQYNERKRFNDFVDSNEDIQLLDTVRKDKLYGVVDSQFYIIQPNAVLKRFENISDGVQGLNYVVDAFSSFYQKYTKMIAEGTTSPPAAIGTVAPVRSYLDFEETFLSYRQTIITNLLSLILEERNDNITFMEFYPEVMKAMFHEDMKRYNFTKTGFVLSRDFSVFSTGLYIDLGQNLSPQIDLNKGRMIKDSGFECYYKVARDYGFHVDSSSPWRLIIDLNSPVIRSNILNGRPDNQFDDFMSDVYGQRIGLDDYWLFKELCANLYYGYLEAIGMTDVQTQDIIVNTVPEEEWLKNYTYLRYREMGLFLSEDFYSPDTDPSPRKRKVSDVVVEVMVRFEDPTYTELAGNHGPLAYLEHQYSKDLKETVLGG